MALSHLRQIFQGGELVGFKLQDSNLKLGVHDESKVLGEF